MDTSSIFEILIRDNSPLSLGFAGAMIAIMLFSAAYLGASRLGWVGCGRTQSDLAKAIAKLDKAQADIVKVTTYWSGKFHASELRNATLQAELSASQEREKFYQQELERERRAVTEWIEQLEKITGIEDKMRSRT